MKQTNLRCPKCGGSMHLGQFRDLYEKNMFEERGQSQEWIAQGGMRLPVMTFACGTCGYLESYVNPPQVAATQPAK